MLIDTKNQGYDSRLVIRPSAPVRGEYDLAFRDTRSGKAVLDIPVLFTGRGGDDVEHR